jgi:hypothetical protein
LRHGWLGHGGLKKANDDTHHDDLPEDVRE